MNNPVRLDAFPRLPGVYVLWLRVPAQTLVSAGRLGRVTLEPGWLAYVGSAHGPGGLRGRLAHHLRAEKPAHWHVDALTLALPVAAVWVAALPACDECRWAALLADLPGASWPARGFGASDCGCPAHLIRVPDAQLRAGWVALGCPPATTWA
jgi:Uri superfamily endonuclease